VRVIESVCECGYACPTHTCAFMTICVRMRVYSSYARAHAHISYLKHESIIFTHTHTHTRDTQGKADSVRAICQLISSHKRVKAGTCSVVCV
jgi:hypothetical protein